MSLCRGADYYGRDPDIPKQGELESYELIPEMKIKRDQLLTVLPQIGSVFKISFDLFISEYHKPYLCYGVIVFTADIGATYPGKYGDRHPGVYICGDQRLYICQTQNGNNNLGYKHTSVLPVKKWISVETHQSFKKDKAGNTFLKEN